MCFHIVLPTLGIILLLFSFYFAELIVSVVILFIVDLFTEVSGGLHELYFFSNWREITIVNAILLLVSCFGKIRKKDARNKLNQDG